MEYFEMMKNTSGSCRWLEEVAAKRAGSLPAAVCITALT
jgi:hypothetical protein